jgi:predicted exporter
MNVDQTAPEDVLFLLLGIATLAAYAGLVLQGMPAEQALGLAGVGGLGAAFLVRTAAHWVLEAREEPTQPPKGQHLDAAIGEEQPPAPARG